MTLENTPTGMSVSLTENERKIVRDTSVKRGLHNFSAALRMIVNEWYDQHSPTPPENGDQDREEA
jgi:hypothetical protein